MCKRKRTLENVDAEVNYLIYLLSAKHLKKKEDGLKERLRVLEKEMLAKGGMHLIVNGNSAVTHAMNSGKAICGTTPKDKYVKVGISPTCKRCLHIIEANNA